MSFNEKIAALKAKRAQLSPDSPLYSNYTRLINDLEKEGPKLALHVAGDSVCESCEG